ncbi:hypothetical protein BGZ61DRAFT_487850 [Ilyonectria robusta]|uniref:uncharacterized protein n=1 Tax=Ilyonectria robusta TaxID=1079257 RepID=UPI001E8E3256|nr:uncharacterized protein BGZ61DRAFT_487850 [Ilyonectria robusta]KAH8650455.1 hypothetical protein BGZ61DRAFT_487850 [Ilyonectria robusta]
MSGFEIVGVVLGGLPLAIDAARGLESYLKGIKAAWLFRRHFKEFIRAITLEEIFFIQNLDLLLTPLDLSDRERQSLKDSQTSNFWHHPDIVNKIRQHHKYSLPVCIQFLRELDDSLNDLYKILPIKNGKVSLPPPGTVESEILRLCVSFSQNKKTILKSINKTNKELERLLHNTNSIALMSRSRPTSSKLMDVSPFIKLQQGSQALFRALKSGLRCSCKDQHRCGLSTQWEKSKLCMSGPTLNLLIDDPQGRKQVRWEVEAADRSAPSVNGDMQHDINHIHELDRQVDFQEQKKGFVKAAQDGSTALLAVSAIATAANPKNMKPERIWTNSRRKLTKPVKAVKSALKSSTSSSSTQVKTIQIQVGQLQVTQPARPQKRVQMAVSPTPTKGNAPVTNICRFIQTAPQNDKFLGTIEADHHDIGLYLEPRSQRRLLGAQDETMEAFWTSTKDPSTRLGVGLSMAVTLLSLGTSAWVPRSWTRKDVFLMQCGKDKNDRGLIFGPYFNHRCLSTTLQKDPMSAESHAEMALFALGVFLLELHYQEPLEKCPYWAFHCPGGKQDEGTPKAAAHDWYEELAMDPALEEGLAEPIRRCIGIKFSTIADLGSSEFLRDVVETVVQPLEEYIDKLSGGTGY